jgi:hypothetical protein
MRAISTVKFFQYKIFSGKITFLKIFFDENYFKVNGALNIVECIGPKLDGGGSDCLLPLPPIIIANQILVSRM